MHITTHNAPYIYPSHDSILQLWQTFPKDESNELTDEDIDHLFQYKLLGNKTHQQVVNLLHNNISRHRYVWSQGAARTK